MNKRKNFINGICLLSVLAFVGCGTASTGDASNNIIQANSEIGEAANLYDTLSDEQIKYLQETYDLERESIDACSYEGLNYKFLGTGMELYNQSSGVEIFGTEYKIDDAAKEDKYGTYYYDMECQSDKLLSYEEALALRQKEKDIRIDDYLGYKYTIKTKDKIDSDADTYNYTLKVEMADYKGKKLEGTLYTCIYYSESKKGDIVIKYAPMLSYEASDKEREVGIGDQLYSFYYAAALRESFFDDPYAQEGKVYCEVQYSSVTNKSMVIEVLNCTDKDIKCIDAYKLYIVKDGNKELVKEFEGNEERDQRQNSFSIYPVDLGVDGNELEKGDYIVEFGTDKKGYVYDELEFTVQ